MNIFDTLSNELPTLPLDMFVNKYIYIEIVFVGLILYCVFLHRNSPVFYIGIGIFVGEIFQSICYVLHTCILIENMKLTQAAMALSLIDAVLEFLRVASILAIMIFVIIRIKKKKSTDHSSEPLIETEE